MDEKHLEIRAILHKLSGGKKRKRDTENEISNPLVAYCQALILPHFLSKTKPDIPFEKVKMNFYNVEGNPPHTMLELHEDYFDFL